MVNLYFFLLLIVLLRLYIESDMGGIEVECLYNLVVVNM